MFIARCVLKGDVSVTRLIMLHWTGGYLGPGGVREILPYPSTLEQRVATGILASTVVCADTPHGAVVKQAISGFIRKHKETVPTTPRVFYSKLLLHRSVNRHSMYRLKFREWEIHI